MQRPGEDTVRAAVPQEFAVGVGQGRRRPGHGACLSHGAVVPEAGPRPRGPRSGTDPGGTALATAALRVVGFLTAPPSTWGGESGTRLPFGPPHGRDTLTCRNYDTR
ncbi:hypothetical protein TNCT6_72960 [Streptomyces sp. 6-11-2]|nr:hypothetical protein TNCT6_72960 [Streptomyces sp. 6-11-2]